MSLSRMSERPIRIVIQKLFMALIRLPVAESPHFWQNRPEVGHPAIQPLVHDLASVFVFDQYRQVIAQRRVDVHRDAANSRGSLRKDEPLAFIRREVEEIGFVVYLKIQLVPLFSFLVRFFVATTRL